MKTSHLVQLLFGMGFVAQIAACSPGGGCYWTQQNFQVAPPESCIHSQYQSCDANNSLTLQNGCADPLVVNYSQTDGGESPVTVAPGASAEFVVAPFVTGGTHVSIPATLGTTAIVISYDVH
jgi:hypothetical protein